MITSFDAFQALVGRVAHLLGPSWTPEPEQLVKMGAASQQYAEAYNRLLTSFHSPHAGPVSLSPPDGIGGPVNTPAGEEPAAGSHRRSQ